MVPTCSAGASVLTENFDWRAACSQLLRAAGSDDIAPEPPEYEAEVTCPWRLTRTLMIIVPVLVPDGLDHDSSERPRSE